MSIRSKLQKDHVPNLKGDVKALAISLGLHSLLCPRLHPCRLTASPLAGK